MAFTIPCGNFLKFTVTGLPVLVLLFATKAEGLGQPPSNVRQRASTTYQINRRHTGAIEVPGLEPPLFVKWSVNLNASVSYQLIAEGKVFVLAGPDPSQNVNLYALDGRTGSILWGPIAFSLASSFPWAAAAYENGKVFVVPYEATGYGGLFAYAADTGTLLWETVLAGQYAFSSPPSAFDGIVYTSGQGERRHGLGGARNGWADPLDHALARHQLIPRCHWKRSLFFGMRLRRPLQSEDRCC
jgi:hypothetical protein